MPDQAASRPTGQGPAFRCEHGAACHDGTESAAGTAPELARSWLLIEHDGPWPAEALDAELPGILGKLAVRADELGTRVQLIRRPGRRRGRSLAAGSVTSPADDHTTGTSAADPSAAVFVGWSAGSAPWLLRGHAAGAGELYDQLTGLPDGVVPSFGEPQEAPLYLVCAHGRRDVCCARLGLPLARALGAAHPGQVWETTHVGGHRYAANLVILPHGLYYGPVDAAAAVAAADAYRRGEIVPARYRGRAGQAKEDQQEQRRRMLASGNVRLDG